jgi:hypothetical protein
MISSHLFRGLPTGLPPPKRLPNTIFGIRCCYILTTWPAHINIFTRMNVEKATRSKYLSKDFPYKGIDLICGCLGNSPHFATTH